MANLKLSLGLIQSTEKIEQAEADLVKEYEKLQSFRDSEELKKYNELHEQVNSSEFVSRKKEIIALNYKSSEEANKENELKKLEKSKDIKLYFKTKNGEKHNRFKKLEGSEQIKSYEDLAKTVNTPEFRQKQKSKDFKGSEDEKKLSEYKSLRTSSDIKFYFKFLKSSELINYNKTEGSAKLDRLEELREFIRSDDFSKRKEYLLDKKRYEKSDLFIKEQEYIELKKSEDIVWYFKVKDSDKFDVLKNRRLTFSDEFDGDKLDSGKWMTRHYWANRLLKENYSQENDLHCYTDNENTEVRSSLLQISTKKQKAEGKVWNPELGGFRNKEFSYTSGMVNTANSFRQQYGVFKAKIKLSTAAGTSHAFRLLGEKISPHLDICRVAKGKVWFDYLTDSGKDIKKSIPSKYARDFYIYSLEWTPSKITWKINDVEILSQSASLPDEPLFLTFTGGLEKALNGSSSLEVDWVRVYQDAESK